MSQIFSPPRFRRVLQNDVLRIAKPLLYGTLALLGLTILNYLANFEPGKVSDDPPICLVLFSMYLAGSGLLFTASSFNDMHHPLERYHYLMLPVSNLERFLSRYLLTGPLLLLYVILAFSVMDWTANQVSLLLRDISEPLFAPFSRPTLIAMRIYLSLHALMFIGAICFRSYAWIKTPLFVLLVLAGLAATFYISLRIFYYDAFSWAHFHAVGPIKMYLVPIFQAQWVNVTLVTSFVLWILYVAFRCLRVHEVQE
jgi:hypothetical protein